VSIIYINPYQFVTAPVGGFDYYNPANIGQPVAGGYFAGLISHTANGVATHALIVAPAETGASGTGYTITAMRAWKTTQTTTAGATSEFDGAANTAAMVAAGIADHPAAEFCVGLTIDGLSDWYLPARLELDIAYELLKPGPDLNSTSAGTNIYAVPARSINRTTTVPGQTSVVAFQEGQPQVFTFTTGSLAGAHWSSTEATAANGWPLSFHSGQGNALSKTVQRRVRAFRRVAL